MVVIPHTMAVCLIYSVQAPGLFVPDLSACKERGLFLHFHQVWENKLLTHSCSTAEESFGWRLASSPHSASSSPQHLKAPCLSFFLSFIFPFLILFLFLFLFLFSPAHLSYSALCRSLSFCLAVFLSQRQFSPSENNRKSNRSECQGEQQSLAPETFFFLLFQ